MLGIDPVIRNVSDSESLVYTKELNSKTTEWWYWHTCICPPDN